MEMEQIPPICIYYGFAGLSNDSAVIEGLKYCENQTTVAALEKALLTCTGLCYISTIYF